MTDNLYLNLNLNMAKKFVPRVKEGMREFAFQGGRRSGKTFFISQTLMMQAIKGDIVNMASMTGEQGRLGVYADCKTIIAGSPALHGRCEVYSSPREIRFSKGKMFFNSYQDPERAKGIACDWLFINEANNFTKQQYIDLVASVRKGVFIDFNPNTHFWVDEVFKDEQIIRSTWEDNRDNLTPLQIKYFEGLKERAFAKNATSMDMYLYRVYYLGEYGEIEGEIFNAGNIQKCDTKDVPADLTKLRIMVDPSALMANDFCACVFAGYSKSTGKVYILDTYSIDRGTNDMVADKVRGWLSSRDGVKLYTETNGQIGIDFFNYMRNDAKLKPNEIRQGANKFQRICANYHNITDKCVFVKNNRLEGFLTQVYEFGKKCLHDDNIDAVSSVIDLILKY